jgi:hypothetical protein
MMFAHRVPVWLSLAALAGCTAAADLPMAGRREAVDPGRHLGIRL